ncbi:MAG: glycosyltransferase [Gammaproteobacteria bacterium]|nr:glycosyltransferase [Gammaproteobacteria bacterium]
MSRAPFVSVVMNGFNSAAYLQEALDSLVAQSFADWELIFWDNQSEDQSESIVRGVGDARFHFYCASRRMSLAEGRNEAITRASGRWIAFLDCDDRWFPDKLARQIERLGRHCAGSVGIVYARTLSFSAHGAEGETTYRYAGRLLPEGKIVRQLLLEGNIVPIVSAMVSREAVDTVGPIPSEFTFAEDYFLFTAIAERFQVLCVQEPCCEYRVHPDSATARNRLTSHREALAVVERFAHLLTPDELRSRRAVYATLIGVEMARSGGKFLAGIRHILRQGSIRFLLQGLARTFVRHWVLRRQPYS